ncbi:MAG: YlbF family regulator [Christensenellaceae bacterium]|nr:YlbF family regulator [Christensenellaceae bacterium]
MKETVFIKARELGEEIKNSQVFKDMTLAEQKANTNPELISLSGEYEQLRHRLQELSLEDEPDKEKISEIDREMQSIKEKMLSHADMKNLSQKREAFSALMDEVNRELQLALMPNMQGCPGSCSSCSGC